MFESIPAAREEIKREEYEVGGCEKVREKGEWERDISAREKGWERTEARWRVRVSVSMCAIETLYESRRNRDKCVCSCVCVYESGRETGLLSFVLFLVCSLPVTKEDFIPGLSVPSEWRSYHIFRVRNQHRDHLLVGTSNLKWKIITEYLLVEVQLVL